MLDGVRHSLLDDPEDRELDVCRGSPRRRVLSLLGDRDRELTALRSTGGKEFDGWHQAEVVEDGRMQLGRDATELVGNGSQHPGHVGVLRSSLEPLDGAGKMLQGLIVQVPGDPRSFRLDGLDARSFPQVTQEDAVEAPHDEAAPA
jgi:hypothetical protein